MEDCNNKVEEPVTKLKRTTSFSGSEIENSSSTMRKKIVVVPTEVSENVNGDSAELFLVNDGQNCRHENIDGKEENLGFDSLHTSILVEIMCKVSHDQLDSLSTVSHKFEEAVNVAKEIFFDYKTPPVCVKSPESSLLNAPKKPGSSRMSKLSAQDIKELKSSTCQTRMMIQNSTFQSRMAIGDL
ncbi:hypothetical protein SUGI_0719220 [Cryptomeria japonica]|uniref:uncharacterized protein LOC131047309 n=1 Tax=Cryptomeria japonica TaxID=3369 RepID=UPI002414B5BE|nr:uncharacterized protein LOC131047309 [Cryptomeria japonica]GLJ35820.1 hypothetical protein SUGI_0719220 [Cryptomeria japonica]